MAEVINQHQTGAFTVPVAGQTNAASNVLTNDNALRSATNAHDVDAGIHLQSGTSANRTAFGTSGAKWLTSDTHKLYYDTGAAWVEIDYVGASNTQTIYGKTAATLTIGASGTALTQFTIYSVSLVPTTLASAVVAEVSFTVTGLTTADKVVVNHPAISNNVTPTSWRVQATDVLYGAFLNVSTATSAAGAAGTYHIIAIRS